MPKKATTLELSISPRIAGRYAAAAKRLEAKSTAGAPTAPKMISLELMGRTPRALWRISNKVTGFGVTLFAAALSLRNARKVGWLRSWACPDDSIRRKGRSAAGLAGAKERRRSREPGAERQTSRAVPPTSAHQPCASRGAGTSGATSAGLALVAQDAGYGDTIKNASENTESQQRP